jgi:hypothetical protein
MGPKRARRPDGVPRPDFLIVGAARSGTTSLYRYLRQHPDVFLPDFKEPDFFVTEESARGVRTLAEYERLFRGATQKAIGEASVGYLPDPGAARRIRETLGPGTRIVALLRDPVEAAWSLWNHTVRTAGETLSFAEALAAEPGRLSGEIPVPPGGAPPRTYAYLERVRYAPQVRRFLDEFGPARVHVAIHEEFFADPAPAYAAVCRFLGVDDGHRPSFDVHNPARAPRWHWLADVLGRRSAWKAPLKILPAGVRDRIRHRIDSWNLSTRPPARLRPEVREELRRVLDPDVRELERVLGRSLREVWW